MKGILNVHKDSAYSKYNGQEFEIKEIRICENQILNELRVLVALEIDKKTSWSFGNIADFYVNERVCEVKFTQKEAQTFYESILWHGSAELLGVKIHGNTFEKICNLMGIKIEYTCPA